MIIIPDTKVGTRQTLHFIETATCRGTDAQLIAPNARDRLHSSSKHTILNYSQSTRQASKENNLGAVDSAEKEPEDNKSSINVRRPASPSSDVLGSRSIGLHHQITSQFPRDDNIPRDHRSPQSFTATNDHSDASLVRPPTRIIHGHPSIDAATLMILRSYPLSNIETWGQFPSSLPSSPESVAINLDRPSWALDASPARPTASNPTILAASFMDEGLRGKSLSLAAQVSATEAEGTFGCQDLTDALSLKAYTASSENDTRRGLVNSQGTEPRFMPRRGLDSNGSSTGAPDKNTPSNFFLSDHSFDNPHSGDLIPVKSYIATVVAPHSSTSIAPSSSSLRAVKEKEAILPCHRGSESPRQNTWADMDAVTTFKPFTFPFLQPSPSKDCNSLDTGNRAPFPFSLSNTVVSSGTLSGSSRQKGSEGVGGKWWERKVIQLEMQAMTAGWKHPNFDSQEEKMRAGFCTTTNRDAGTRSRRTIISRHRHAQMGINPYDGPGITIRTPSRLTVADKSTPPIVPRLSRPARQVKRVLRKVMSMGNESTVKRNIRVLHQY
ncbi:hypothetical protein FRB95_013890 [Tulasnella sp. JGI-2019a]|nr:hypothetical protein FRB95_013890 [Tulasnella sp. JGI-2019a]